MNSPTNGNDHESLSDREKRLRAILDTAVEGIITIDENGLIESINPSGERLFQYKAEELLGRNVSVLMPPPYAAEHDGYIDNYKKTSVAKIIGIGREVTALRKDGTTFPVHLSVSEVPLSTGRIFTGFIHDLTQRAEAEARLLDSARLAAIGEAMAGMAHESRNALQRSQACLDLLADRVMEDAESNDLIEGIQRSQDELYRLYEEVRKYAAPVQITPETCNAGEIVRRAWGDIAQLVDHRDATLEEVHRIEDLSCIADPFSLTQVFRNILENSADSCADPMRMTVTYSLDVDADSLVVSMLDNGPGIPPENAGRVFDSFFTTRAHGTGLGMAIAHRIMKAHRGDIRINPAATDGAEFIVTIPRHRDQAAG